MPCSNKKQLLNSWRHFHNILTNRMPVSREISRTVLEYATYLLNSEPDR